MLFYKVIRKVVSHSGETKGEMRVKNNIKNLIQFTLLRVLNDTEIFGLYSVRNYKC